MVDVFVDQLWSKLEKETSQSVSSLQSQHYRNLVDGLLDATDVSPFSVGWAAHRLLEDGVNLSDIQYIALVYVLERLCHYSKPQQSSPLYPLLMHHVLMKLYTQNSTCPSMTPGESEILLKLMDDFLPTMVGMDGADKLLTNLEKGPCPIDDVSLVWFHDAIQDWITRFTSSRTVAGVSPLIYIHGEASQKELARLCDRNQNTKIVTREELLSPFAPVDLPFARPLPPPLLGGFDLYMEANGGDYEDAELLEFLHAELIWLTPTNLRLQVMPQDDEEDNNNNNECVVDDDDDDYPKLLELLNVAFRAPLSAGDEEKVLEALQEHNDRLLLDSGLSPRTLSNLVEHNPILAHDCLVRILEKKGGDNTTVELLSPNDYLSALVTMDMSLHSMEVVNRLAPQLHPEFLHLFISNCIVSCENNPGTRLIRLVCIFLQSLIRNNLIPVKDVFYEVQAFCIEFSRIREAAALFKLLKSMQ